MTDHRFTLGIEEEFQLVDCQTGEMRSCAQSVLEKCEPYFEEKLKPELMQSTIELVTSVLPDITTARAELYAARALLTRLLAEENLALVSGGTHPGASWLAQEVTPQDRYREMMDEYQDVARSGLIFGLHVHVAVPSPEISIAVMNQARTWLPHLLALSSNSPFWHGRMTGLKSHRSAVWKRFPRSGMPDVYPSRQHFDRYVQTLVAHGVIDNGKKIWWDVRPHPFYGTIEFRICDMPATLEDTLSIAALCQALVARLVHLNQHGEGVPTLTSDYLNENKWRAMRYGLDAEVLDFLQHRNVNMRDSIRELLEFVSDEVEELGSQREMEYIYSRLDDPRGTGADHQIAVYQQSNGDVGSVQQFLVQQTRQNVLTDAIALSQPLFTFRMYERMS
ncbi:MAG TPA: carboxylate-amine ligase [Ktedonobacteraceae bacterium]